MSFRKSIFFLLPIAFFLLFLTDCATQRESQQIEERTELPVFEGESEEGVLNLPVVFHINEDGSVENVQMLSTSGDSEWDSMAVDSMKQWEFTSPPADSNGRRVRKNVRVELRQSEILNLGVLTAGSEEDAEVLYNRLRAGIDFEQLVNQTSESSSIAESGSYLEDANTADFPSRIGKILLDLNAGEISRPVMLDGEYVIFKRYGDRLP